MGTRWETYTLAGDTRAHRLLDDHDGWMAPTVMFDVAPCAGMRRWALVDAQEATVMSLHDSEDAARRAAEDAYDDLAEAYWVGRATDYDGALDARLRTRDA